MDQQRERALPKPKLLKKDQVQEFFDVLARKIDPKGELDWEEPLDLVVAVVLSAQSTDVSVNKVTPWFRTNCKTPADYLRLSEEELQDRIKKIGLYRNKSKSIRGICQALIDNFDGQVPTTRKDLESLPGVGRKTANVILNVAFGQPTLAVDTHVFRVANRTGLVHAKTPGKTEQKLLKIIPSKHLLHAHHYLILHGRYTCKARKPLCRDCPVAQCCNYPEKEE